MMAEPAMAIDKMAETLRQAGFSGIEQADGVIFARLWSSSVEFTAEPDGARWMLTLLWPVRATQAQIAGWMAQHPDAQMDIHAGETRLRFWAAEGDHQALARWAALAEAMVAQCIQWRRAQRAPGEGM
jgi:hypothetical protein